MPYKFARERGDYSDLASGKVFHSLPGYPAFPIRLGSEIFQRCLAGLTSGGAAGRVTLYDPCCGGAYHLATLACLHWDSIDSIIASDIDPKAVQLAQRNLALLTLEGVDRRVVELADLWKKFGKESHRAALRSADQLRQRIDRLSKDHMISTRVFAANAMDGPLLRGQLQTIRVGMVFTDVPYGRHSAWQDDTGGNPAPLWRMLDALHEVLVPSSLVAVVADKRQKVAQEAYDRVDKFQIGKRQVVILKPIPRKIYAEEQHHPRGYILP
jgi:tRNA G10  N-methylase Trm11